MRFRSPAIVIAAALVAGLFVAGAACAAEAPPTSLGGPGTYGQHLVERALAAYPQGITLTLHALPPKATDYIAVASNASAALGKSTGKDELAVINGGAPTFILNDAGTSLRADVPLKDVSGLTIGAIELEFSHAKGEDMRIERQVAAEIQSALQKHVLSVANLLDAYPYSPDFSPENAAQALVDKTTARHPELLVLGMHVTLPDGRGNYMLGANIGRVGKKADEDDMRVVTTGKSNFEVADNGRRYEVELVLEDAAHQNIGALGVVLPYKDGDDKAALNALAVKIRDEMAAQIPSAAALTARPAALSLAGATQLPGYTGDFDHFAVDPRTRSLFLAGEDGAALEVFNLDSGAFARSIGGYGVPHSIFVMPKTNELLVIDAKQPSPILDAATLTRKRALRLPAGADSATYDPSTKHLWVVTGGKDVPQPDSNLIEIDPATGKIFKRVHFAEKHVEAMVIEQHGSKIFINLTGQNSMAVIDKRSGAILQRWPIRAAQQNAPIAFDEPNHRLFVVTRKPGMLLVMNSESGAVVASFKGPQRADQVVWDAVNRRVYMTGGEGYIGVFQQDDPDHYSELARVPSASGAKTAILVPSLNRLYVAASPGKATGGALLRFDVGARP